MLLSKNVASSPVSWDTFYFRKNLKDTNELIHLFERLDSDEEVCNDVEHINQLELVLIPTLDGHETDQEVPSKGEFENELHDIVRGVLREVMEISAGVKNLLET